MSPECLIIDDLDEATTLMSPLGRELSAPAIATVRTAVYAFAERRGWNIVKHTAFAAWAAERITSDESVWLTLDPLLAIAPETGRVHAARFSRRLEPNGSMTLWGELPRPAHGVQGCGILDDAASSGSTLLGVLRALQDAGSVARSVLLCASSRGAHERVSAKHRSLRWMAYLPGDWRVIHLRDALVLLPHTGRATDLPPLYDGKSHVEIRTGVSEQPGSLWQVATMDSAVREAIEGATAGIAERLSDFLGRPARLVEVGLLGPSVPAPTPPPGTRGSDVDLVAVIRSRSR